MPERNDIMCIHSTVFGRVAVLGWLILVGCGIPPGEDRDVTAVLTSVLYEAQAHIRDVSPILLHPRQLQIANEGFLLPGVEDDHYKPEPWPALIEAAERSGIEICEVGEYAMCVVDESLPLAGFIALSEVALSGDTARVLVAAIELGGEWGYAAIDYEVRLARSEGGWRIDSWREVGSAN